MINKKNLGLTIRKHREKLGVTREELCDTEEVLNVRQLARIELGQSIPTIDKLDYIADRLNIKISELLSASVTQVSDKSS